MTGNQVRRVEAKRRRSIIVGAVVLAAAAGNQVLIWMGVVR